MCRQRRRRLLSPGTDDVIEQHGVRATVARGHVTRDVIARRRLMRGRCCHWQRLLLQGDGTDDVAMPMVVLVVLASGVDAE